MQKISLYILSGMFILSVLAGCATTTQFSTSQTQSESRDAQITDLTIALEEERQEKQRLLKVIQEHEARIEELVLESQEAKTTGEKYHYLEKTYDAICSLAIPSVSEDILVKFASMLWEHGHLKTYYDDLDYGAFLKELLTPKER